MPGVVLLAGIVLVLVGFFIHKRHKDLVRTCTMQVAGEVIRNECREETSTETDSDGHRTKRTSIMYYPVFQYTVGERTIQKTSTTGSSRPGFREGQSVTIMYDPANPERYYVVEDKTASRFGIYFMLFGAVVFIIGIVAIFVPMS